MQINIDDARNSNIQQTGLNLPGYSDGNNTNLLSLEHSIWAEVIEDIIQNQSYMDNKKNNYFSKTIRMVFEQNEKYMPVFNFPLTRYIINMLATLYNNKTVLPTVDRVVDDSSEKGLKLDADNVLFALNQHQISYFLNDVAFMKILNKDKNTVRYASIKAYDLVYDCNFEEILLRVRQIPKGKSIFEYYRVEYDYYTDTQKVISFTVEGNGFNEVAKIDYKNLTPEIIKAHNISAQRILPALPIVPMFGNSEKTATLSPIAIADEVLNVLFMFGLAGLPSSLMVKWFINVQNSISRSPGGAKMKIAKIFDMMDVQELLKDEKLDTVKTGDGNNFVNFMVVFEAVVSWMAQMMGVSKTSVGSQLREVRQSAASKGVSGSGGDIYRSQLIILFSEFESRLFEATKKFFVGADKLDLRPIDKDNISLLANTGDLLTFLTQAVKEKFIPYIDAFARLNGVTTEEAEKLAQKAKEQFEKYGLNAVTKENGPAGQKKDLKSKALKGKIRAEGGGNAVEDHKGTKVME